MGGDRDPRHRGEFGDRGLSFGDAWPAPGVQQGWQVPLGLGRRVNSPSSAGIIAAIGADVQQAAPCDGRHISAFSVNPNRATGVTWPDTLPPARSASW
jgi:hypothetical protein